LLWSSLKQRELANLAGDHLADVADVTEQGIHRINTNCPGPSSPTPASPSTHQAHRTNEKIKVGRVSKVDLWAVDDHLLWDVVI
ncbi:hypothetical protein ACFV0H_41295, partial [Streptomyces erythrochromogenes]